MVASIAIDTMQWCELASVRVAEESCKEIVRNLLRVQCIYSPCSPLKSSAGETLPLHPENGLISTQGNQVSMPSRS